MSTRKQSKTQKKNSVNQTKIRGRTVQGKRVYEK